MSQQKSRNTYHIGQAGAVGAKSRAENFTQIQSAAPEQVTVLAAQLHQLREHIEAYESGRSDQSDAAHQLTEAESSARDGNSLRTNELLSKLGPWVLTAATELGLGVAAAAIAAALGVA